jgi:hypothetical protein
MRSEYSLYIGCPTYNKPDTRFSMDSYGDMLFHIGRKHPEIKHVWRERNVRTYRQGARQAICDNAKLSKATHFMMLDDDMTFDPDTFDKVWEACIAMEKPSAVSALYFVRSQPVTVPCIWRATPRGTVPIYEYPANTVITNKDGLDVVGFGFILFDSRVLDQVTAPWFNIAGSWGEDAAFCARLIQSGCTLAVHTGAKCGHIHEDPKEITEADYLAVKEELLRNGSMGEHTLRQVIESDYSAFGDRDQKRLDPSKGWRADSSKNAEVSRGAK